MSPFTGYGKRRRRTVPVAILWCLVVNGEVVSPAAASPVGNEAGNAYAALTADYRQGDFGTSINSELYSLTPEFGYVSDGYDLSASVPFHDLHISGGGLSSSESGIGDAVLRAGKRIWRNRQATFSLNGSLTLKLATGDENRGLGTGATDAGASLSATRKIGAYAYTVLAGYTRVGEPSGVTYDNAVSYGIGVNRSFTRTNVFVSLQGQTSVLPGGTDPLELDTGFFHMLSLEYVIIAHAFVGLSDGSPDGGMGVGIVRWF
jgi:hypothetical protein